MDPKITRKGKEKNRIKNKGDYKYGNKRVRQVEELMKEANMMQTSVFKDYSNQPRFVIGTITQSKI